MKVFSEDKEFLEKYARSTYKLDPNKIELLKKYSWMIEEDDYCHLIRDNWEGKNYLLTREETIHLYYCQSCDKLRINNSFRYCRKECPYYFSFEEIRRTREPLKDEIDNIKKM